MVLIRPYHVGAVDGMKLIITCAVTECQQEVGNQDKKGTRNKLHQLYDTGADR
jgi:hypothetical protein